MSSPPTQLNSRPWSRGSIVSTIAFVLTLVVLGAIALATMSNHDDRDALSAPTTNCDTTINGVEQTLPGVGACDGDATVPQSPNESYVDESVPPVLVEPYRLTSWCDLNNRLDQRFPGNQDDNWYMNGVRAVASPNAGTTEPEITYANSQEWCALQQAGPFDLRYIVIVGQPVNEDGSPYTDEQARAAATESGVQYADRLPVVRQQTIVNSMGAYEGEGVVRQFLDGRSMVRVSLGVPVVDSNGNVTGMETDRGIFEDCLNGWRTPDFTPTETPSTDTPSTGSSTPPGSTPPPSTSTPPSSTPPTESTPPSTTPPTTTTPPSTTPPTTPPTTTPPTTPPVTTPPTTPPTTTPPVTTPPTTPPTTTPPVTTTPPTTSKPPGSDDCLRNGGQGEGCPSDGGQAYQPVNDYDGNQSEVDVQPSPVPTVEPQPLPTPTVAPSSPAPDPTPGGYQPDPSSGGTVPGGAGVDPDGSIVTNEPPADSTTVNDDLEDETITEVMPTD